MDSAGPVCLINIEKPDEGKNIYELLADIKDLYICGIQVLKKVKVVEVGTGLVKPP